MSQFHQLRIASVKPLTADAVSITFEPTDEVKSKFTFLAGQYISLKAEINGETVIRDYSICSCPSSGALSVGIKTLKGGLFSSYAQTLKPGDTLLARAPQGKFTLDSNIENFVGIAAGSGITPMMSLLQDFLEHSAGTAYLMYGNKSPEDSMFLKALKTLKNTYRDRLQLRWMFSRQEMPEAGFGRINGDQLVDFLKEHAIHVGHGHFYLCGPNDMVQDLRAKLSEIGHADSNVRYELFFAPPTGEALHPTSKGQCQVSMVLDGESVVFEMTNNQFVLDAALDQDLDAPYSCRGGVCSSCIAKVTEGSVEMAQNNVLTDADLSSGYILTCQARPTRSSRSVDCDDV